MGGIVDKKVIDGDDHRHQKGHAGRGQIQASLHPGNQVGVKVFLSPKHVQHKMGLLIHQAEQNAAHKPLCHVPLEALERQKHGVFEDYVQPNNVVESGEFDANYFQHINYLNSFNEENGTHLVVADNGKIHYEPFGIYGGTKKDLADLEDGDAIAVPNDTTNEARALLLLQQEGLIKLADGVDVTATVNDIVENPKNLEIVEVEAAQVPKQLGSVAFGVINGNYALQNGLNVEKDALAVEAADGAAIQQYVNIIAVKEGNEANNKIVALTAALKSAEVVNYINDTYEGAVVPYVGE